MSANPYESPTEGGNSSKLEKHPERDNLRFVAKYQRYLMISILTIIGVNMLVFFSFLQPIWFQVTAGAVSVVIALCHIVVIYELANRLTSSGAAMLCSLLTMIPIVNLVTFLVLNQKATNYLQENGIRVGFTGANPADL